MISIDIKSILQFSELEFDKFLDWLASCDNVGCFTVDLSRDVIQFYDNKDALAFTMRWT